ncbi:MAG: RtcB family protein [Planctomycetia bacterium]|nr:RtcB family protein [Planctomycetia bacterium]
MKKVISTEKKPIKLWLDNIEDGALEQAKNLANLPFVFKHIAIMPDSHQGYGMPIGGVMATKGVVIPNAVGVDIGCGMCAVKTSLTDIDTDTLKKIMGEIRQVVPVGFKKHKEIQDVDLMPKMKVWNEELPKIVSNEYQNALKSLGSLGGGNHFIEIQKGSDGHIWIMIHSGSRNLGKQVADHYNKLAIELNEKWFSEVKKEKQLAFLPLNSEEGQAYIREMNYCIDFALANRRLMMACVYSAFAQFTKELGCMKFYPIINISHNYAQMENHFGENVMIHRKGATLATEDTIGIIPGSQGTKSYIVKGKGNQDSFNSCSHGAGRKMGRKDAERNLNLENEIKKLDEQGIIHSIRGQKDLDEAPGSYKDISEVMENQKDLVEVLVELSPLAVIKG